MRRSSQVSLAISETRARCGTGRKTCNGWAGHALVVMVAENSWVRRSRGACFKIWFISTSKSMLSSLSASSSTKCFTVLRLNPCKGGATGCAQRPTAHTFRNRTKHDNRAANRFKQRKECRLRVRQVIDHSSRCAYNDVWSLPKRNSLHMVRDN